MIFWLLIITSFNSLNAAQNSLDKILAKADEQEFLKVDEAFKVSSDIFGDEVLIRWDAADGYYLYKHPLKFQANGATIDAIYIPAGLAKVDQYFGDVEVYYQYLEVSLTVAKQQPEFDIIFKYQGCADAGLCYTPETRKVSFSRQPDGSYLQQGDIIEASFSSPPGTQTQDTAPGFQGERQLLTNILSDGDFLWIALAFFGAGLLLTFTPCVLPMIPILSSIIAGQGKEVTTWKAFKLSFVYVQAMAVTYALFGILVAQAGGALSGYLQSPVVLGVVAVLFIVLAMSMFGLYELQLPRSIQDRLQSLNSKQSGGQYLSVIIMGVLATLVVSPCTSAPLTAALLLIAQKGDVATGGFSLYMLGMGMGLPLILLGIGGGKWLPKAGAWMDKVKAFFGYMLLALALYITSHLLPGFVYLGLFSLLLIHASYYFGAFKAATGTLGQLSRALSMAVFVVGLVYMTGAFLGNNRLSNPLDGLLGESRVSEAHLEFEKFKTFDELQLILDEAKAAGKPVMLDFFAEWCVACYEFEDFTFKDKAVQAYLAEKGVILLQADVTANDASDRELMQEYQVLGLPTIMFFDDSGEELTDFRATGFEEADVFLKRLNAAFGGQN
jgi:thiol:disulfide interchange protein DsbD